MLGKFVSDRGCAMLLGLIALLCAIPFFFATRPGYARLHVTSKANLPSRASGKKRPAPKKKKQKAKTPKLKPADLWKSIPEKKLPFSSMEWSEVYRDEFDREAVDDDWLSHRSGPEIQIIDGQLAVRFETMAEGKSQKGAHVICTNPKVDFRGDWRVEYAGRLEKSAYQTVTDLSFMVGHTSKAPNQTLGAYFFAVGSLGNTEFGLRGIDPVSRVEIKRKGLRLEEGKRHVVVIMKSGNRYLMKFDGKTLFSGLDKKPHWNKKRKFGGFYTWKTNIYIDYFSFSRPAEKKK
jgi:hypothetical protein